MVTDLKCWWQDRYVRNIFRYVHQDLKLVIIIFQHPHQHRCRRQIAWSKKHKTVFLSKVQLKPSKTKFRFISTFGSASFRTGYRGNESFSREMNTIKRFRIRTLSTHSFSRPSNVRLRKPSIFKFWKWPKFQGIMCFWDFEKAFRQIQLKISSHKSNWLTGGALR